MGNGSARLRELYEARMLEEAKAGYARMLLEEPGSLKADDHLTGALTLRLLNDYAGAKRALELGESCYPPAVVKGRLLMTKGVLLREIGDTSAAIECLERFRDGLDEYPELKPLALGACWFNLGLAFRGARRLQDAQDAYENAAAEFRREHMTDYLRQTLQNMAWLLCILYDADGAERALDEAEPLCTTGMAQWHQRIGWAFSLYTGGEKTASLAACEEIIRAETEAPPGVISHAYWLAGKIALDLGENDHAETMANQSVSWSLKVKDDVRPMQDANALRREIYQTRVHKDQ